MTHTSTRTATVTDTTAGGERADILEALRTHRGFLRHTVRGLGDEQARERTTASELTLGGLIKHVARIEAKWIDFLLTGPEVMAAPTDPAGYQQWADDFRLLPGETLEGVLAEYDGVARRTDELVLSLPDLDASQPLPPAPWFAPGSRRSARRVFLHVIAETAQHAGHADILRESLDGQKTMG
jgi:Protein of unknown function (DUF664)